MWVSRCFVTGQDNLWQSITSPNHPCKPSRSVASFATHYELGVHVLDMNATSNLFLASLLTSLMKKM